MCAYFSISWHLPLRRPKRVMKLHLRCGSTDSHTCLCKRNQISSVWGGEGRYAVRLPQNVHPLLLQLGLGASGTADNTCPTKVTLPQRPLHCLSGSHGDRHYVPTFLYSHRTLFLRTFVTVTWPRDDLGRISWHGDSWAEIGMMDRHWLKQGETREVGGGHCSPRTTTSTSPREAGYLAPGED